MEHSELVEIAPVDDADPACAAFFDGGGEGVDGIGPAAEAAVDDEFGQVFVGVEDVAEGQDSDEDGYGGLAVFRDSA